MHAFHRVTINIREGGHNPVQLTGVGHPRERDLLVLTHCTAEGQSKGRGTAHVSGNRARGTLTGGLENWRRGFVGFQAESAQMCELKGGHVWAALRLFQSSSSSSTGSSAPRLSLRGTLGMGPAEKTDMQQIMEMILVRQLPRFY